MENRLTRTRFSLVVASFLITLTAGSCNFIDRGDFHGSSENAVVFSSIGFLASDNTGVLYRDAVKNVHYNETDIVITIPYFQELAASPGTPDISTPLVPDSSTPLVLSFDVEGVDTVVSDSIDGVLISGVTPLTFHDGTNPQSRTLTIEKTDPVSGMTQSNTYTLSLVKKIKPRVGIITNPGFPGTGQPGLIDLFFEDELGNLIETSGAKDTITNDDDGIDDDQLWLNDGDGYNENYLKKDIQVEFTTWNESSNHYYADAYFYAQGSYTLAVPDDPNYFKFVDANGYQYLSTENNEYVSAWDPDAIYMATGGNDTNEGTDRDSPVATLNRALDRAQYYNRFEIRVAEGLYDFGGNAQTVGSNVSIYGGYTSDFSSRWDVSDSSIRENHGSRFRSNPPPGPNNTNLNGVLIYEPQSSTGIGESTILDGVNIEVDITNSNNHLAALVVRAGSYSGVTEPLIRNCTIIGNAQGGDVATGVFVQGDVSPTFLNNTIWSSHSSANPETTNGIYLHACHNVKFIHNKILARDANGDCSYGIIADNPADKFLIVENHIVSSNSFAGSYAVSISNPAAASTIKIRRNVIESGGETNSDVSTGVNIGGANGGVFVNNNVILAHKGNTVRAIRLSNRQDALSRTEVINNAIRVGTGSSEENTNGLFIAGAIIPNNFVFANNLVDAQVNDMMAIRSWADIRSAASITIQGNAYDDADHNVVVCLTGGGMTPVPRDAAEAQDNIGFLKYNIEKNFAFNERGVVTSGMDANLAYGGVDGGMISYDPQIKYDFRDNFHDRQFTQPVEGGWSIGPIEYDTSDAAFPGRVHVALGHGAGGTGGEYLLGTRNYPYQYLETAYRAASDRSNNGSITGIPEILVTEGIHNIGSTVTIAGNARILGGWTTDFSNRNPDPETNNCTLTIAPGSQYMFFIESSGVDSSFLMESFTLTNPNSGSAELIRVRSGASPVLRNLIFNSQSVNNHYTALFVTDTGSQPEVYDCKFNSGSSVSTSKSLVVDNDAAGEYWDNAFNFGSILSNLYEILLKDASPEIHHNVINGGSPNSASTMMRVEGSASPAIYGNTINGGDPNGLERMMEIQDTSSPTIRDNEFIIGAPANNTVIHISDSASPNIQSNILTGGNTVNSETMIDVRDSASPEIHENIMHGGSSPTGETKMIMVYGFANPNIHHNEIIGGSPFGEVKGIVWGANSSGVISHNTIFSGNAGGGDAKALVIYGVSVTPEVYENVITSGNADSSSSSTAISATGNSAPEIHHNRIYVLDGPSTQSSFSIYADTTNGLRVHDNEIFLGDSGDSVTGIYLKDSSNVQITNNIISDDAIPHGNRTDNIWGISITNGVSNTIQGNTIDPRSDRPATTSSQGLSGAGSSSLTISDNTISGGWGLQTVGVILGGGCDNALLDRNKIYGGDATLVSSESVGVFVNTPGNVGILNNLIHGGGDNTAGKCGLRMAGGTIENRIYNNTIYSGRGPAVNVALHTEIGAEPQIINNIIIAGDGGTENLAMHQESGNRPTRFLNNLMLGADPGNYIPYRHGLSNDCITASDLDAHLTPGLNYGNHLIDTAANPNVYLTNFTAAANQAGFLNDNWRLTGAGTHDAAAGGTDMSSDPNRPYNHDHDNVTRSVPWSVGAYEY